eukprot:scaffold65206_cov31-Tisochrysis_lutea.AAC.2
MRTLTTGSTHCTGIDIGCSCSIFRPYFPNDARSVGRPATGHWRCFRSQRSEDWSNDSIVTGVQHKSRALAYRRQGAGSGERQKKSPKTAAGSMSEQEGTHATLTAKAPQQTVSLTRLRGLLHSFHSSYKQRAGRPHHEASSRVEGALQASTRRSLRENPSTFRNTIGQKPSKIASQGYLRYTQAVGPHGMYMHRVGQRHGLPADASVWVAPSACCIALAHAKPLGPRAMFQSVGAQQQQLRRSGQCVAAPLPMGAGTWRR